jgi:hypothetical protein
MPPPYDEYTDQHLKKQQHQSWPQEGGIKFPIDPALILDLRALELIQDSVKGANQTLTVTDREVRPPGALSHRLE